MIYKEQKKNQSRIENYSWCKRKMQRVNVHTKFQIVFFIFKYSLCKTEEYSVFIANTFVFF